MEKNEHRSGFSGGKVQGVAEEPSWPLLDITFK